MHSVKKCMDGYGSFFLLSPLFICVFCAITYTVTQQLVKANWPHD